MDYCFMDSPIGSLLLVGDKEGLKRVGFPSGKGKLEVNDSWNENSDPFTEAMFQLNQYFKGKRKNFDLRLKLEGTDFQVKVLTELQKVPFGETVSYGELARRVGNPKASRAVGAVNAKNPLPIVIPCHRVIGANGSLTGFGGGIPAKITLLELERKYR